VNSPVTMSGWVTRASVKRALAEIADVELRTQITERLYALARGESFDTIDNPYPTLRHNDYRRDVVDGYRILFRPLEQPEAARHNLKCGIAVAVLVSNQDLQAMAGLV
jgi:hypothetical protein